VVGRGYSTAERPGGLGALQLVGRQPVSLWALHVGGGEKGLLRLPCPGHLGFLLWQ
jgi:hypothetical protein